MKRWANRVVWSLLLLSAAILYLFGNQSGTRVILAVCVVLPLLSAAFLYLPKQEASAALDGPEEIRRDRTAKLQLTVGHPVRVSALLCGEIRCENLLTGQTKTLPFHLYLRGKKDEVLEAELLAAHCGTMQLTLQNCVLTDPLNLFTRKINLLAERQICVKPKPFGMTVRLCESADYLEDNRRCAADRPGYDPSETYRIREYQPGDPIRQIHWKLSEKTQKVFVRDLGLPMVEQLLLLQELTVIPGTEISPKDLDRTLDALYSVSEALLRAEIRHRIAWQDNRTGRPEWRTVDSEPALEEAFTRLLSAPLSPGNNTVCGCWAEYAQRGSFAHAAVFSAYPEPDLDLLCHGNIVTALLPAERLPNSAGTPGGARYRAIGEEGTELEL